MPTSRCPRREGQIAEPRSLAEELLGAAESDQLSDASASKTAVAWARVSTDMQEERGLSIPQQLMEIRDYARAHGIAISAEFSEAASAFQKEAKRVEFRRMLAQAKSDASVDTILVHDFSRFSRDSVRAKALVRELGAVGV